QPAQHQEAGAMARENPIGLSSIMGRKPRRRPLSIQNNYAARNGYHLHQHAERDGYNPKETSAVPGGANPEQLIVEARRVDAAALGTLLDLYRNHLRLVALLMVGEAE